MIGPFSPPGFELSVVREVSNGGFLDLACNRKTGNFQCRIDDVAKIGLIHSISVSFVPKKAMKPVTLGDPAPYWRAKEGRELFRLCHRNTLAECDHLRGELRTARAVPPGTTDFYYAVTMIDGRTLSPQRRQLQTP